MIRRLTSAAAIVALGASLAACGTDSSSTGSTSPGSTSGANTIASALIMGGPSEFKTRRDGLDGLQSVYGVTFGKYTVTDTSGPVTVNALKGGQIDVANIFSTDTSIQANDFVVLTDPKSNFAAQNVTPIVNKDKATDGVRSTLNAVSAKLTTEGLTSMVGDVQDKKMDPAAVAKTWLTTNAIPTGTAAAGQTLTVGSANFPENVVLAQIYLQALQGEGATVNATLNIGSREKYYPALQSGSIDVFPEYNGTLLSFIDKTATAKTTDDVAKALTAALPATLVALDPAPAQDSDALVVTKATAQKYNLVTIGDLAKPLPAS